MTQSSYPWDGNGIGDASNSPYDANEFALNFLAALTGFGKTANYGPVKGYDNGANYGLEVTQVTIASINVEVKVGAAIVRGTVFISDATETLAIAANASGNPRIDTIILRKDYVLQTVRLVVKQGTPAATPVAPTLTQTDGLTWEIPLADINVANGFSTITNAVIYNRQQWVNVGDGSYLDGMLNSSGGTLEYGDVVIRDTAANSFTTTAVANHSRAGGVVIDRSVANAAAGRLLLRGFAKIRIKILNPTGSQIIAPIGTVVTTGTEAKKGTVRYPGLVGVDNTGSGDAVTSSNTGTSPVQIGTLQEAVTVGAGVTFDSYALVLVDVYPQHGPLIIRAIHITTGTTGTFTSGAWQVRTLNNLYSSAFGFNATNPHVALSANTLTIQPGVYYIRASAPAYRVDGHQIRLQDTGLGITLSEGTAEYSPSAADSSQTRSSLEVILHITTAKTIQLQHRCTTTRSTDGFGVFSGFMSGAVLASMEIIRLGDVS